MDPSVFPRMYIRLFVSDLDNTISFYNSFFGRYPAEVSSGYAEYVLDQPSLIISFAERRDHTRSHFGHLGFQVQNIEVLQEVCQRLREMGLDIRTALGGAAGEADQNKFWVDDPDGIVWQVYSNHPVISDDRNNGFDCDPALKESSRAAGKPCC